MKLTSMKMKTTMGALAMLLAAGASNAAVISPCADLLADNATCVDPTVTIDGNTFDMTIRGSEFAIGTSGGGLTVTWDAARLDLVSWDTSVFAPPLGLVVPGGGTLDQAAGTLSDIDLLSISIGSSLTTFDIVTLTFLAQAPGNAAVTPSLGNFSGTSTPNIWVDQFGVDEVVPTYTPGSVQISAVPVPAAVWLFGSGLIGLVGIARRRRSA
jgi:hypothetical protein